MQRFTGSIGLIAFFDRISSQQQCHQVGCSQYAELHLCRSFAGQSCRVSEPMLTVRAVNFTQKSCPWHSTAAADCILHPSKHCTTLQLTPRRHSNPVRIKFLLSAVLKCQLGLPVYSKADCYNRCVKAAVRVANPWHASLLIHHNISMVDMILLPVAWSGKLCIDVPHKCA